MSQYRRRNSISEQFSARSIEMQESPAYRVLSRSGHMVISRLEIELGHHGGNDNGKLPVTVEDFVAYGMHRTSVAPAIREAEALGFIRVTERGRGGNAEHRAPNRFFLTFARGRESRAQPPTHDWRKITTMEEAERTARDARAAKNSSAVAHGKRSWSRRQKTKPGAETSHAPVRENRTEPNDSPLREIRTTGPVQDAEPLSIRQEDREAVSHSPTVNDRPKPKRDRAQYMRDYRARRKQVRTQ